MNSWMQILIQITSKHLSDLSRNKIPSGKMFMLLVVFLANYTIKSLTSWVEVRM